MNKQTTKEAAPEIRTRAEMEKLAGELAELKSQQRLYTAEMDAGLNVVRRHYAEILGGLDDEIAARVTREREWAEANVAAFGGGRSLELAQAVIGYRTGQPQLKTLTGWTWQRVLEKAKGLQWAGGLVRTKEEVNKQRILSDRDAIGAEKLRELGVKVVQEETFFVETKAEVVEGRERMAA